MRDARAPYKDKEWLYTRYVLQRKQAKDIAAEAGVTSTTIGYWIKRHGLKRADGKFGTSVCEVCGKEFVKSGPVQKYCTACSAERDKQRKREWAKKNAAKVAASNRERVRKNYSWESKLWKEVGLERSLPPLTATDAMEYELPDFRKRVWFYIPYSRGLSKNALWSLDPSRSHVYVRREVKQLKEQIAWHLRTNDIEWHQGKVWIDILVEKPDHKSDAINLVDTICDAVKEGLGIDDRWFAIRRVDWRIVKSEPRVWIGVGQEVEEHHLVCSSCGRVLPITEFPRHKNGPFGRSRRCNKCQELFREKRREIMAAGGPEKCDS